MSLPLRERDADIATGELEQHADRLADEDKTPMYVAVDPIAAGLLYPVAGTLLSPMIAAAAMALSSMPMRLPLRRRPLIAQRLRAWPRPA